MQPGARRLERMHNCECKVPEGRHLSCSDSHVAISRLCKYICCTRAYEPWQRDAISRQIAYAEPTPDPRPNGRQHGRPGDVTKFRGCARSTTALAARRDRSLCLALLAVAIWYLYRRDAVELPRPVGIGVVLLRLVAFAGLVVFFLGIERRTTREVVHNSQVAVLVDVSQSMGLGERRSERRQSKSRLSEVISALAESPLVAELRKTHDVNIARFDREVEPVVSLVSRRVTERESRVKSREPRSQISGSRLSTLDS